MIQNAKDVANPKYGGVSIEFEIADANTFIFRHNGLFFTVKNVTSLIQQVSSKSSTNKDENITGLYGTGFISTHLIADIIDVKGILQDEDCKFRHFALCLDRSGASREELIPKIEKTLNEFQELDNDSSGNKFPFAPDYEQHTERDFDTSFTYNIKSESQLELARNGINDLVNTLPVAIINLPTVKSVRVIDRLKDSDICYTCQRKEMGNGVVMSTILGGDSEKHYLTYTTSNVSLSIEARHENNEWSAIKRSKDLPVLLRDFPLIGSEKFYFPYFLNGFRFFPTEPRDGIFLHGDSDDTNSVNNRTIIEKAVDAALVFNQWLIDFNIHNRYLLASSRIPVTTEQWDKEISKPWIDELQTKWRSKLLNQLLLESDSGVYPISEMILPYCETKESREIFWDLLKPIATRKLPRKESLHEWYDVINKEYESWNMSIRYSIDDFLKELETEKNLFYIIEKFNGNDTLAYEWLNKVVKFIYNEKGGSKVFEEYAIIPNQVGDFQNISNLYRDNTQPILQEIKDVYAIAFEKDLRTSLLNENINPELVQFIREYNLTSLMNELNTFIKNDHNEWKCRRDASYRLCTLYSSEETIAHRQDMFELCKKFTPKVETFNKVSNLPNDIWLEADKLLLDAIPRFVIESGIKKLSELGSEFLNCHNGISEDETLDWINSYLSLCREMQCIKQLEYAVIFPNQKGEFKKIEELHFDANIPEEVKDLSETASTNVDWRACLLDRRIRDYETHSPKNISDIMHSIQEVFIPLSPSQRLRITKPAMALNYNSNSDVDYVYGILKDVYNDVPEQKILPNADGFDWDCFINNAIWAITKDIAEMTNIESFKKHISTGDATYDTSNAIEWIDKLLHFVFNRKNGIGKPTVTEEDGHGIWVNQHGVFCMFADLYIDGGIAEELKDLTASNPILNHDYRKELLHRDSIMRGAIDPSKTITQDAVLLRIDKAIKNYDGDKQKPDFGRLVFGLIDLDKSLHIIDKMEYFKKNKEKLIVGSIGEGETMNIVAAIIQQGQSKLNLIRDLANKTEEDLREFLKPQKSQHLTFQDLTGKEVDIPIDCGQYSGLSEGDISSYLQEAKDAVVKYYKELNERDNLGMCFDEERIKSDSYSQLYGIYDKDGNELPLVVHSYRGPEHRNFALNGFDWDMLSKLGAQLWVNTVGGLQCVPLYALPIKEFSVSIDENLPTETKAALLALAFAAKQFTNVSFGFGNNMPSGFKKHLPFSYLPKQVNDCTKAIKDICQENTPDLKTQLNCAKSIPLRSGSDYSEVIDERRGTDIVKDLTDAPKNSLQPPEVCSDTDALL